MHLERMDKILASRTQYSRKDAKKLIWQGRVLHNGKKALSPDVKIDLDTDTLELDGKPLLIQKHLYLMLNKPSGFKCCPGSQTAYCAGFGTGNISTIGAFPSREAG